MTVTITPIGVGTVEGDDTGDKARVGAQSINANEANLKAAVESLEGRFWTVRNTTLDPLVIGTRYMANNHAGITFTTPATFTLSATAVSDIWITNADDASNITLTPASGDAFFVDGATHGVDTTYAITPGNLVILSPRTTDSEWDLIVAGGAGGWADMSAAVWAGGTQSEVADGASAVAFDFDTDSTYSTDGANLARFSNNTTAIFDFSYQGGIDHANSGASTAAHSQSVNLNFNSSATNTSSGQYAAVIGQSNKASNTNAMAFGKTLVSSGLASFSCGESNTASGSNAAAFNRENTVSGTSSAGFGRGCSVPIRSTIAIGGAKFSSLGDAQIMISAVKVATTDATQTTMQLFAEDISIPADTTWVFDGLLGARSDETDGNVSAGWKFEGVLYRDESGNTVIQGVTVTAIYNGFSTASATITADDTNEALAIQVTGEASTNIRWVAHLRLVQIGYA